MLPIGSKVCLHHCPDQPGEVVGYNSNTSESLYNPERYPLIVKFPFTTDVYSVEGLKVLSIGSGTSSIENDFKPTFLDRMTDDHIEKMGKYPHLTKMVFRAMNKNGI